MGLLDGILGGALGSVLGKLGSDGQSGQAGQSAGMSPLIRIALQLLQQSGGLNGILEKLRKSGFGQQADSWVSTGPNLQLTGPQVSQALGPDMLQQLAGQVGMDPQQLSEGLSQVLPEVVNEMTPAGQIPADNQDTITRALRNLG